MFDYEQSFTRTDEYGQTYVEYYPGRYINEVSKAKPNINGTWVDYGSVSSRESSEKCTIETTSGEILNSGSVMQNNISCKTHTYNAGNNYNYPAASASTSEPASSSICPLGWKLPEYNGNTRYSNLLLAYGIDFNAGDNMASPYDAALLNLPLSFLRSGYYNFNGNLSGQGSGGFYRMSSLRLYFNSSGLGLTYPTSAGSGFPVRCVSR